MRIGDLQRFEDRGAAAVLAPLAVQRIEGDVGLEVLEDVDDPLARDVNGYHLETGALRITSYNVCYTKLLRISS